MLIGLASASLYKRDNCNKYYMLDESVFYKCQHVNYWTDKVAQAKIENKTYRFDPFSPFKIWLNESGIPIGMSSSDRYVFVVKDGQINTTERMSWSLNRCSNQKYRRTIRTKNQKDLMMTTKTKKTTNKRKIISCCLIY